MTDCSGVRKLVKDMYGQYCFNFVGTLGGYRLKNFEATPLTSPTQNISSGSSGENSDDS